MIYFLSLISRIQNLYFTGICDLYRIHQNKLDVALLVFMLSFPVIRVKKEISVRESLTDKISDVSPELTLVKQSDTRGNSCALIQR